MLQYMYENVHVTVSLALILVLQACILYLPKIES